MHEEVQRVRRVFVHEHGRDGGIAQEKGHRVNEESTAYFLRAYLRQEEEEDRF